MAIMTKDQTYFLLFSIFRSFTRSPLLLLTLDKKLCWKTGGITKGMSGNLCYHFVVRDGLSFASDLHTPDLAV